MNALAVHLRTARRSGLVALTAFVLYAALLVAFRDVGVLALIQDGADVPGRSPWVGLLSNVGILGWIAAASIALFAAAVTRHDRSTVGRLSLLLLCGGALSLALGVDDFFLLHDRVVPQRLAYGAYAVLGLLVAGVFGRELLSAGGMGVLVGGLLLASSIGVDLLQNHLPFSYTTTQVVEEGLKFAGITCWLVGWCRVSSAALRASSDRPRETHVDGTLTPG